MTDKSGVLSELGVNFVRTCTDKSGFLSELVPIIGGDIIVYNNILYGRRGTLYAFPPPPCQEGPKVRAIFAKALNGHILGFLSCLYEQAILVFSLEISGEKREVFLCLNGKN